MYNLVGKDGGFRGDEKPLELKDGIKMSIRILGFRHDGFVRGGKVGISFEFADASARHRMNNEWINYGGWEASEMRGWLNDGGGGFLVLLPDDLRSYVAVVAEHANNWGRVPKGNISSVTATHDMFWLLSLSEVYGEVSDWWNSLWSATYDAEGEQYKLYADKGVSTSSYGSCKKREADSWWWLRSPSRTSLK